MCRACRVWAFGKRLFERVVMISIRKEVSTDPYESIAGVYDAMMQHVDYDRWVRFLVRIFGRFNPPGKELLEMACGTGTIAIRLAAMGYKVKAFDRSAAMVACANTKARQSGSDLVFSIHDALKLNAFDPNRRFDAVLCLYDSVNYLLEESEVAALLASVRERLRPAGILIFDITTERNSIEHFSPFYENNRDHGYTRKSYYLKEERIQVNEITVVKKRRVFAEKHLQRIYSATTMEKLVSDSGFHECHAFEDFSFRKGSSRSERIHFVAVR